MFHPQVIVVLFPPFWGGVVTPMVTSFNAWLRLLNGAATLKNTLVEIYRISLLKRLSLVIFLYLAPKYFQSLGSKPKLPYSATSGKRLPKEDSCHLVD